MKLILKGSKKSIDILLRKNKRFIEKYDISIDECKPDVLKIDVPPIIEKAIEVVDNKSESLDNEFPEKTKDKPAVKRTRRTKEQIELDKNK